MKPVPFKECKFLFSSDGRVLPKLQVPHIILAGRSNVGKSSFINHLCGRKGLAKVSSVPGKTRLINFFLVDEALFLVDLPGYGYAKVSKTEKGKWQELVELYLEKMGDNIRIIHLLDARHPPSEEDLQFIEWATSFNKKILFVFTKIDKIKKNKHEGTIKELVTSLGIEKDFLPFSIEEGHYKKQAIVTINKWLTDGQT